MFIDSSAFVALLTDEPDSARIAAQIETAKHRYTSGIVRLESVMRAASKLNVPVEDAQAAFDLLIAECKITVVPITDAIAKKAVDAFSRYGKGKVHPAQLNLGDCLSYAVAAAYHCPILFIGEDFTQTDLKSALSDPAPIVAP